MCNRTSIVYGCCGAEADRTILSRCHAYTTTGYCGTPPNVVTDPGPCPRCLDRPTPSEGAWIPNAPLEAGPSGAVQPTPADGARVPDAPIVAEPSGSVQPATTEPRPEPRAGPWRGQSVPRHRHPNALPSVGPSRVEPPRVQSPTAEPPRPESLRVPPWRARGQLPPTQGPQNPAPVANMAPIPILALPIPRPRTGSEVRRRSHVISEEESRQPRPTPRIFRENILFVEEPAHDPIADETVARRTRAMDGRVGDAGSRFRSARQASVAGGAIEGLAPSEEPQSPEEEDLEEGIAWANSVARERN